MKVTLQPGSLKPVMHLHESGDETFEVISGKLSYQLGHQQGIIGPGEKILLPKSVPHTHFNAEDAPLVVYQTIAPALDFAVGAEPFRRRLSQSSTHSGTGAA